MFKANLERCSQILSRREHLDFSVINTVPREVRDFGKSCFTVSENRITDAHGIICTLERRLSIK